MTAAEEAIRLPAKAPERPPVQVPFQSALTLSDHGPPWRLHTETPGESHAPDVWSCHIGSFAETLKGSLDEGGYVTFSTAHFGTHAESAWLGPSVGSACMAWVDDFSRRGASQSPQMFAPYHGARIVWLQEVEALLDEGGRFQELLWAR